MLVSTHFFSMVSTTTCHYGKCLPISSYKKHTRADYPYHSRNTTSTTLGVRMACVPMDYLNVEFFVHQSKRLRASDWPFLTVTHPEGFLFCCYFAFFLFWFQKLSLLKTNCKNDHFFGARKMTPRFNISTPNLMTLTCRATSDHGGTFDWTRRDQVNANLIGRLN